LELSKIQKNENALVFVLDKALRLLHPIMPHISEHVWQLLPCGKDAKTIMQSEFPTFSEELVFEDAASKMETVIEAIRALRNLRASFNISPSIKINIQIAGDTELFGEVMPYLKRLARVEEISFIEESALSVSQSASCVVGNSKIVVPLAGLINIEEEIARQNKKLEKLENEKKSLEGRTSNERFLASAPPELVAQTRARIEEIAAETASIQELVSKLS
jgi:valyl-tRNA synthetase